MATNRLDRALGILLWLLLGLTSLHRLRAKPFAAELETAEHKLLAAVPDHLREILAKARHLIGFEAAPTDMFLRGLLWDRDRWYLIGPKVSRDDEARLWRADRVLAIRPDKPLPDSDSDFNVETLLGRQWLSKAMSRWADETPVAIRLTPAQAGRLKRDWYYGHARYETLSDGDALMTYGESNRAFVFELVRWLGPGAELVEPREWRAALGKELEGMVAVY